jgi:hypothetical protein
MSIIKWQNTAPTTLEQKIQEWRQENQVQPHNDAASRQGEIIRSRTAPYTSEGSIVDLPRVCAVLDRPYAARYIMVNGIFRLQDTLEVPESVYRNLYLNNDNVEAVPLRDLGCETCSVCGARQNPNWCGPVKCNRCHAFTCYGRTVDDYHRCRPSCGAEGQLTRGEGKSHNGLAPRTGGGFARNR